MGVFFLQAFANRWQTLWTGLKRSYLTPETSDCIYLSLIIVIAVQPDVWKLLLQAEKLAQLTWINVFSVG